MHMAGLFHLSLPILTLWISLFKVAAFIDDIFLCYSLGPVHMNK